MTDQPNALTIKSQNTAVILSANAKGNTKQRLSVFVAWLDSVGQAWHSPDMTAYRDYLLSYEGQRSKLSATSINSYLSTVRACLRTIARNNETRNQLYVLAGQDKNVQNGTLSPKEFVDEIVTRLENAIDPKNSTLAITKVQDVADSAHERLSRQEINLLLAMPGVNTLLGIRDTALIALMVCTGIRREELCNVRLEHLRETVDGELTLLISHGKGDKQRAVPYGGLTWCLDVVDSWLDRAGITEGFVFRGVRKGGKSLYSSQITTRSINKIFTRYQITRQGKQIDISPHDIRRSYARNLYDSGLDIMEIKMLLGHSDHKTTEHYIGVSNIANRAPQAIYSFDLSTLKAVDRQEELPL